MHSPIVLSCPASLPNAKWCNSDIRRVKDGKSALARIDHDPADLILTDLQTRKMNGQQLVTAVRDLNPSIPMILMTAKGIEDIAAQTLNASAASYVPTISIAEDLTDT